MSQSVAAPVRSHSQIQPPGWLALCRLSEAQWLGSRWEDAGRLADEACHIARRTKNHRGLALALQARATVAAHQGRVAAATSDVQEGIALAGLIGDQLGVARHLGILGFLHLSLGDPERAARHFELAFHPITPLAALARLIPDHVESLVRSGEISRARALLRQASSSAATRALLGTLAGRRCRALVEAASGEAEAALCTLETVLRDPSPSDPLFERGRGVAVQGIIQRRLRQRAAAVASFDQAIAIFDSLGASLWSDRTMTEYGRASARRVRASELTSSEQAVGHLVAAGRTNQEIAAAMFISLKTVEVNLTRIYRKLGIRSRTELAVWMERRTVGRFGDATEGEPRNASEYREPARVVAMGG